LFNFETALSEMDGAEVKLTSWSRVLLEKLIQSVSQDSPTFMEPEGIHRSPPLVLILGQMNPVHTLSSHFCKIHSNIIITPTLVSSDLFLSLQVFRLKLYIYFSTCSCVLHAMPISSFLI
jgi:hypothetical protein